MRGCGSSKSLGEALEGDPVTSRPGQSDCDVAWAPRWVQVLSVLLATPGHSVTGLISDPPGSLRALVTFRLPRIGHPSHSPPADEEEETGQCARSRPTTFSGWLKGVPSQRPQNPGSGEGASPLWYGTSAPTVVTTFPEKTKVVVTISRDLCYPWTEQVEVQTESQ